MVNGNEGIGIVITVAAAGVIGWAISAYHCQKKIHRMMRWRRMGGGGGGPPDMMQRMMSHHCR